MAATWTRPARHRVARALLASALLGVPGPAWAEGPLPPLPTLDAQGALRNTWTFAGQAGESALRTGGHVVRGAGQVGQGVVGEVGGAAGQVVDDVKEGRLRWVIGPAREAILTTPQLHTAVRNSRAAAENARVERQNAELRRRFRWGMPAGWEKPVRPTRQVVARQVASSFKPTNMLLTVGLTVAGGMVVAAQDEDVTWKDALASVGDKSLWTAILGSGLGYAIASLAATALFPAGGTLFPVVAPMIVGTTGAIIGWIMGEKMGQGLSFGEAFESLSLPSIVGLSVGASLGLLAGVALGAAVGGPVGAVVATVGAIVGTLLFRKLGLRAGDLVAEAMGRDPISEDAEEEQGADTEADAHVEGAPAAPGGGDYRALVRALEADDRERARRELEGMRVP